MLKADLHSHTVYSYDCCNSIDGIIKKCNKVGINCLAVTDHNEIKGAFELQKHAPFRVIIGEEIDTGEGEVTGLFLNKLISPGQGIHKTIDLIKSQNGIVYIPHPLSISRNEMLNIPKILERIGEIDIIEYFNSRTLKESRDKDWLDELFLNGKVIKGAGSDAHAIYELGNVIIELDHFEDSDGFLKSLSSARFHLKKTQGINRLIMNHRTRKILRKWMLPKKYL